jgi:exodeoxyribonuclease VII small subunit
MGGMSDSPPDNPTFEQALTQLEQIVRELEDGSTGLEESLARYEAGVALLKRCYAQLRQAEQRILQLTGLDEQGRPATVPFEHCATLEPADRADARKRRKKAEDPGLWTGGETDG